MEPEDVLRFRRAHWQAVRETDIVRLRMWEQSRLTLPQLRVLYQIRRTPGITTRELSHTLGITVSTTSGLVTKLVDRGLIERTRSQDDRRQAPLRLTETGTTVVGELAEAGRPLLERVAAHLGDDLGPVTEALERLAEAAARARREAGMEEPSGGAETDHTSPEPVHQER
jgi:DNA-binding MarR family transcriptional regulator